MTDNKLVKLAGEHWVCSVMAGYGWAVALTHDGLARTDILAVHADTRRMVEVQVKTASHRPRPNWPLNKKAQQPAESDQEWFVLVVLAEEPAGPHRAFVVPRDHVAAAAWICHMDWKTDPTVEPGRRNATLDQTRVNASVFEGYEARWDLLEGSTSDVPVLLPPEFRALTLEERVGLPPEHPWCHAVPVW